MVEDVDYLDQLVEQYKAAVKEFQEFCKEIVTKAGYGEPPDLEAQKRLWKLHIRESGPTSVKAKCAVCGKTFYRYYKCKKISKPCCSRNCSAILSNQSRPKVEKIEKFVLMTCTHCGKEYKLNLKTIEHRNQNRIFRPTCSLKCSAHLSHTPAPRDTPTINEALKELRLKVL